MAPREDRYTNTGIINVKDSDNTISKHLDGTYAQTRKTPIFIYKVLNEKLHSENSGLDSYRMRYIELVKKFDNAVITTTILNRSDKTRSGNLSINEVLYDKIQQLHGEGDFLKDLDLINFDYVIGLEDYTGTTPALPELPEKPEYVKTTLWEGIQPFAIYSNETFSENIDNFDYLMIETKAYNTNCANPDKPNEFNYIDIKANFNRDGDEEVLYQQGWTNECNTKSNFTHFKRVNNLTWKHELSTSTAGKVETIKITGIKSITNIINVPVKPAIKSNGESNGHLFYTFTGIADVKRADNGKAIDYSFNISNIGNNTSSNVEYWFFEGDLPNIATNPQESIRIKTNPEAHISGVKAIGRYEDEYNIVPITINQIKSDNEENGLLALHSFPQAVDLLTENIKMVSPWLAKYVFSYTKKEDNYYVTAHFAAGVRFFTTLFIASEYNVQWDFGNPWTKSTFNYMDKNPGSVRISSNGLEQKSEFSNSLHLGSLVSGGLIMKNQQYVVNTYNTSRERDNVIERLLPDIPIPIPGSGNLLSNSVDYASYVNVINYKSDLIEPHLMALLRAPTETRFTLGPIGNESSIEAGWINIDDRDETVNKFYWLTALTSKNQELLLKIMFELQNKNQTTNQGIYKRSEFKTAMINNGIKEFNAFVSYTPKDIFITELYWITSTIGSSKMICKRIDNDETLIEVTSSVGQPSITATSKELNLIANTGIGVNVNHLLYVYDIKTNNLLASVDMKTLGEWTDFQEISGITLNGGFIYVLGKGSGVGANYYVYRLLLNDDRDEILISNESQVDLGGSPITFDNLIGLGSVNGVENFVSMSDGTGLFPTSWSTVGLIYKTDSNKYEVEGGEEIDLNVGNNILDIDVFGNFMLLIYENSKKVLLYDISDSVGTVRNPLNKLPNLFPLKPINEKVLEEESKGIAFDYQEDEFEGEPIKAIPKTIEVSGIWFQDNFTVGNTFKINNKLRTDGFGANIVPRKSSQLYTKRRIEF